MKLCDLKRYLGVVPSHHAEPPPWGSKIEVGREYGVGFKSGIRRNIYAEEVENLLTNGCPLEIYWSIDKLLADGSKAMWIPIDVDIKGDDIISSYRLAIDEGRKALELIESAFGMKPVYIALSGSKGVHLVYEDPCGLGQTERVRLADFLEKRGVKFDRQVLVDVNRIIRMPGSWNRKSGLFAVRVNESRFLSLTAEDAISLMMPYDEEVEIKVEEKIKTPLGDELRPGRRRMNIGLAFWYLCQRECQ